MTEPNASAVTLTRLEGKIDLIAERVNNQATASATAVEALQRSVDEIKRDMTKVREEARHDASVVRVDLERQVMEVAADLATHLAAPNPHPQQEEWLRRIYDSQAVKIGNLHDTVTIVRSEARGAGRVLAPLVAVIAAVGSAVLTRALGG